MKLTQEEKALIRKKDKALDEIIPELKKEFIGIDNAIEDIINSIRPYYIFPDSLKRPLIVNLWGLTGTGKTTIVERIVELLNLKSKYYRFDVGEYVTRSSDFQLTNDLSEKADDDADDEINSSIILFDEFQFGRTIDNNGKEIDRSSLRPMWDIIDSGIIKKSNYWEISELTSKIKLLKKALDSGVKVKDGIVVENEDIYNSIFMSKYSFKSTDFLLVGTSDENDIEKGVPDIKQSLKNLKGRHSESLEKGLKQLGIDLSAIVNNDILTSEEKNSAMEEMDDEDFEEDITENENPHRYTRWISSTEDPEYQLFKMPKFIKEELLNKFYSVRPDYFDNIRNYEDNWKKISEGKDGHEILDLLVEEFVNKVPMMQEFNFSKSLIFCVGNIDEAYAMSHSSDPDEDADIFYENSLKINVSKMKHALSYRFRMEQIGRLGNNHIIFPSLNSDSYKKIIDLYMNKRISYFKESFGIKFEATKNLKEIIYKDAVFPSQGVRPVLSSFNTMIDSYISKIISDSIIDDIDVEKIKWDYKDKKYHVSVFKNKNNKKSDKKYKYDVKLSIESLRESDNSENQVYTAVHESGHAVASIAYALLCPKEVVSKTANLSEGFCRIEFPEIVTKDLYMKRIVVSLGGRAAEKLVFGSDFLSNGANSDLQSATNIAASMVKELGMHKQVYVSSTSTDLNMGGYKVHTNKEKEQFIIDILEECEKIVDKVLEDNKDLLIELSDYLSHNSKIFKDDIEKILSKKYPNIKKKLRDKDNYHDFKNTLKKLKNGNKS
jgi:hypothetical protein